MMMRLMAILLLGLFAVQASAAGLFARVDRTQLSIDETLELTLETQGGAAFGKPDLEPLEQLFEIFDTRQVNRLSSSNGEAMASTRWLITLRPRQTGYVVIPPLQVADWRSEPITVLVQESLKDTESDQLAPIFIDASVDHDMRDQKREREENQESSRVGKGARGLLSPSLLIRQGDG